MKFDDRPQGLDNDYWKEGPLTRVGYMQDGYVRTDGKWLAGFYFNAALARMAAAFDRVVTLVEVQSSGKRMKGKLWKRLQKLG